MITSVTTIATNASWDRMPKAVPAFPKKPSSLPESYKISVLYYFAWTFNILRGWGIRSWLVLGCGWGCVCVGWGDFVSISEVIGDCEAILLHQRVLLPWLYGIILCGWFGIVRAKRWLRKAASFNYFNNVSVTDRNILSAQISEKKLIQKKKNAIILTFF